jgi:hypothetical protein
VPEPAPAVDAAPAAAAPVAETEPDDEPAVDDEPAAPAAPVAEAGMGKVHQGASYGEPLLREILGAKPIDDVKGNR